MADVGRPTELNDELCLKIRELVLQGIPQKKIARLCQVSLETFEGWIWRNYKGFADKWLTYKQEWRLKRAEENIDEVLEMDTINVEAVKVGFGENTEFEPQDFQDPKLIKIKTDTSLFVAETLGKQYYSKRSELTGANGKELVFKWLDDNDNDSVQTEEMGEGVPRQSEAVDSAGVTPESRKDDSDLEPPTA